MIRLLLLFGTLSWISSCAPKTQHQLVGQWKMTAIYFDIGDGSGSYQDATEDKHLTFGSDGSVSSDGSLCNMATGPSEVQQGTYSLEAMTIQTEGCAQSMPLRMELKGNELEVFYPCMEPCSEKYEKVD